MIKEVRVGWLSPCRCHHSVAIVDTKGDENNLYEGERVHCPSCFQIGEIWADGENADVVWEDCEDEDEDYNC